VSDSQLKDRSWYQICPFSLNFESVMFKVKASGFFHAKALITLRMIGKRWKKITVVSLKLVTNLEKFVRTF